MVEKICNVHEKARNCKYQRKGTIYCDHSALDDGDKDFCKRSNLDFCDNLADCYCLAAPFEEECAAKDLTNHCLLNKKILCFVY